MSRSHYKGRSNRHYRPAVIRFLQKKGARRCVKLAMVCELRSGHETDERLDVLADLHEERGRLALAELLRRGHNPSV